MELVIVLCFLLVLSLRMEAVLYDKSSSNLDRFPDNITADVDSVDLTENNIAAIDSIPDIPLLVNLTMALNRLTDFPDLVNVSDTLCYLDLSSNMITSVQPDLLDQLRVLEVLSLGDNPLSAIPDVAGPSNTLYHLGLGYTNLVQFPRLANLGKNIWTLYLHGTDIQTVPLEALDFLPNLDYILLFKTRIRQLPNMCHSIRKSALTIDVSYMEFDCNWNFLWLKIATASKHIVMAAGGPSCRRPDGALVRWDEVNTKTLTTSGTEGAYYSTLTDKMNFYCPLEIRPKITASPIVCARNCLHVTDCTLFAVDGTYCMLSTLMSGNATFFNRYDKWFVANIA